MARTVREKHERGPIGWIFSILFWGFNAYMLYALISGVTAVSRLSAPDSEAGRIGAAVGGTIGFGLILGLWAIGAIILGLLSFFTRGPKVLIEDDPEEDRRPRKGGQNFAHSSAPPPRHKICPDCAERILADARVCKHCGFRFDAQPHAETPLQIEAQRRRLEEPAVLSLLALEKAASSRNPDAVLNVLLDYIHEILPDGIKSAAEQSDWIRWIDSLSTDEASVRRAFNTLRDSGVDAGPFRAAAARIVTATNGPSSRQSKMLTLFDKLLSGQETR